MNRRINIVGWWFFASKIVTLMRAYYSITITKNTKCFQEGITKDSFEEMLSLLKTQRENWQAYQLSNIYTVLA